MLMKSFKSLKILEQGIQLVSVAHQMNNKYTQTNLAGLISEINLLAIRISTSVAASSDQDVALQYQDGLKEALNSVEDIEQQLMCLPVEEPALDELKNLIGLEHQLIEQVLEQPEIRPRKRPLKRSRLSVASSRSRAPIVRLRVTQGVQGELF